MTVQYQESIRDLQQLKNQISRGVGELDRLQGEERSKKIRDIEENLSNLNQLIQSIRDEFPMMEQTERSKMTRILQDYQVETQKLEDRFRDAKNRGELMGSSKVILEGGSNSERQQLLNQREAIKEGNSKLYAFNDMGNDVLGIGHGTLAELDEQKEKELGIENKLDDLSTNATIAERTADRMLCRQKRRTAILWIVIVLVFIIFLAVLLFLIL